MGFFFKQGMITSKDSLTTADLLIEVKRAAELKLYEDESYQLFSGTRQVRIVANTDLGAIRGLETLQQLVSVDDKGYYFPGLEISDSPRFPWRGLSARHYPSLDANGCCQKDSRRHGFGKNECIASSSYRRSDVWY